MSYKKFTKDLGILWVTQFISALSGLIILPVITKLLGPVNYGSWIQILVTIGLITPIALLGLPFSLVRFLPGEKDEKKIQDGIWSVFVLIFGVSTLIALILIFFANPVSKFLGEPKIFVIILALIIVFDCLNQLFANIFRAFQQIKKYSALGIVSKLGESGMIILAILLGYGLFGAILSLLIIRIIMFLIIGVLVINKIGIKIPRFWRIKEYLFFGLTGIIGDIASWTIQSSDRYFLAFFLGTIFVGYYSPAYTLGCTLSFFTAPLIFLLPAVLSKHHDENDIEKVKGYLAYSLKYFLIIAIPSVFGLSILSKQLLTIFSTTEIAQQAYFVVPFVALSMLFMGVCGIFSQVIGLKKKNHIGGAIWIIAAVLNFGLNFILVPRFGILGAAITTLSAYALGLVLTWFYSFKKIKFAIDWNFILKSLAASVLMSVFVFYLNPLGLWRTLATVCAGAVLYFFLIFLFGVVNKKELNFLKGLIGKI